MPKAEKCKKVYFDSTATNPKETEKRSWFKGADTLELRFMNDDVIAVKLGDFNQDVVTAAAFHGFSQKLGDTFAGKKDVEEAAEVTAALFERLQEGVWIAERESAGPRTSVLLEAVMAAFTAAGQEVDEDTMREKIKGLETDARKALQADPAVSAQYDRIKAERAAAKAAKSAAKAEDAESQITTLLG